jgi:hypothetical protein
VQAKAGGLDVEVSFRPAIAAVDLQQLPLPDQVADCHRLKPKLLGLATAPGLIPIPLDLDKIGKAGDQLRDPASFIIGQASVRDGSRAIWLAIDMRQDDAIGIDHPLSAGHRLDRPLSGNGECQGFMRKKVAEP